MTQHRIAIALGVLVVGLALAPWTATALSPDEQACIDQGGTYEKVKGTQTCVISTSPGNNQGGVTHDTTASKKGSGSSSHEGTEDDCVNNRGGEHC